MIRYLIKAVRQLQLFIYRFTASIIDLFISLTASIVIVEIFLLAWFKVTRNISIRPFEGTFFAMRFLERLKTGQPVESTLFDPFWYGIWYFLICLYSLPLLIVLILMAPDSLGRKGMRLEVRKCRERKISVIEIRLRESVKWLWLLPGFWLLLGLITTNIEALGKDLLASTKLFPIVLLFPIALFLWFASLGKIGVHASACGTYTSTKKGSLNPLAIILVILVAALLAIVIWILEAKISFHSSWSSYSMTEYSNGSYLGEPRFALAMAVYSVVVFSWTYLVYGMRRRREATNGSQVNEETDEG